MAVKKVKLKIYGMTCEDCVSTISKNLLEEGGIKDVSISLEKKSGEVVYDSELLSENDILNNRVFGKVSRYKATIVQ